MTGALAWQVKTTLNKIFYFLGFGGRRPSLFFHFGLLGRAPPLRACFSLFFFFFFLISLSKVKKTQNLLVLHNAKKLSIHYPIQTSVARIAAPYAAHPKGSLKQKVNCKFTAQLFKQALPFKFFLHTITIHLTSLKNKDMLFLLFIIVDPTGGGMHR